MEGTTLDEVLEQYGQQRPLYEGFASQVANLLELTLNADGVGLHLVHHRAKTSASLAEKLRRPDKAYDSPLDEIDDLAGVRVIVNYVHSIERVVEVCRDLFHVFEDRSRAMRTSANEFGYESAHLVVSLGHDRQNLLEWKQYKDLRLEIQIRTVVQHAWATVSHSLQYKDERDVPLTLRRRLSRVSALLELADDEFSSIAATHQSLDEALRHKAGIQPAVWDAPLDVASARVFLDSDPVVNEIETEALEAGFGVYTNRSEPAGDLVFAATQAQLLTVDNLRAFLNGHVVDRQDFFRRLVAKLDDGDFAFRIGSLLAMAIIWRHPDLVAGDVLAEGTGWSRPVADAVISVANDLRSS